MPRLHHCVTCAGHPTSAPRPSGLPAAKRSSRLVLVCSTSHRKSQVNVACAVAPLLTRQETLDSRLMPQRSVPVSHEADSSLSRRSVLDRHLECSVGSNIVPYTHSRRLDHPTSLSISQLQPPVSAAVRRQQRRSARAASRPARKERAARAAATASFSVRHGSAPVDDGVCFGAAAAHAASSAAPLPTRTLGAVGRRAVKRAPRWKSRATALVVPPKRGAEAGTSGADLDGSDFLSTVYAVRRSSKGLKLLPEQQAACCATIKSLDSVDLSGLPQHQQALQLAEELLVEDNIAGLSKLADFYKNQSVQPDDLVAEGLKYLRTAALNFQPNLGTSFRTYFNTCARLQMRIALTVQGRAVVLPRSTHDTISKVNRARKSLARSLKREPTMAEVAKEVCVKVEKVIQVDKMQHRESTSWENIVSESESVDLPEWLYLEGEEDVLNPGAEQCIQILQLLISDLPDRERKVLIGRYALGDTEESINPYALSKRLGCARNTVVKVEQQAINKLRMVAGEQLRQISSLT
eukprot:CAMPEP_0117667972 /NCGR_PEP_ID=MMETSP0804-20121206/11271_1 /TAXON_ID=1074897 /ORGANISM="Tetraselmis astigmatica, Strain CCMP880" /LENGTH=521 /DNA_ID=CAMNT_0005475773 /DNA_START=108 /DNA_END=1673 /DNA_ORIENTATION=+